jgi:endonuclease G
MLTFPINTFQELPLFYETDTEVGSSGSPVFNKEWKVVALHHYGKTAEEGGVQINEAGDMKAANRGILIKEILNDLAKKLNPQQP